MNNRTTIHGSWLKRLLLLVILSANMILISGYVIHDMPLQELEDSELLIPVNRMRNHLVRNEPHF